MTVKYNRALPLRNPLHCSPLWTVPCGRSLGLILYKKYPLIMYIDLLTDRLDGLQTVWMGFSDN